MNLGAIARDLTLDHDVLKEATDAQLLASVTRDDESAFAELYARYSVTLYNYLFRLTQEQTAAEDLLQEVFVAMWEGAEQFEGRASVKTWAFRIAHNKAISWLRRQKPIVEHDETLKQIGHSDDLDTSLMHEWNTEQLRLALDQLSPAHRSVIELAFVQELSYSEIAQVVDSPVGTIKSRMSYALKYLDGFLRQQGIRP